MNQCDVWNYQPPWYLDRIVHANQDSFSSPLISSLDYITSKYQQSIDNALSTSTSSLFDNGALLSSCVAPIVICYIIIHWTYFTRKKNQQLKNEIHMRLGNELWELNREIQDREDNLYYKPEDPCDDDDDW